MIETHDLSLLNSKHVMFMDTPVEEFLKTHGVENFVLTTWTNNDHPNVVSGFSITINKDGDAQLQHVAYNPPPESHPTTISMQEFDKLVKYWKGVLYLRGDLDLYYKVFVSRMNKADHKTISS